MGCNGQVEGSLVVFHSGSYPFEDCWWPDHQSVVVGICGLYSCHRFWSPLWWPFLTDPAPLTPSPRLHLRFTVSQVVHLASIINGTIWKIPCLLPNSAENSRFCHFGWVADKTQNVQVNCNFAIITLFPFYFLNHRSCSFICSNPPTLDRQDSKASLECWTQSSPLFLCLGILHMGLTHMDPFQLGQRVQQKVSLPMLWLESETGALLSFLCSHLIHCFYLLQPRAIKLRHYIDDGHRNSALLSCQAGLALALLESLKDKRQKNLENLLLASKTRLRAHYLTVSSVPTLNVRSWALILGITATDNFKLPS